MQEMMQPLVHMASLVDIKINIAKSGLCIGDPAELVLHDDGRISVYADLRRSWFGLLQRKSRQCIGALPPAVIEIIARDLGSEGRLRVRIVGLTPEHLSETGTAGVHVSIWGSSDPRQNVIPPALPSAAE